MSHSSLSAQLASLHSKNTTSSRQQSDAVGRGIHHVTGAGHSILNGSTKHKPSVIHADSRAAASADIPFSTLRENAVVSLQYLSQHSSHLFEMAGQNLPWQTLFGSKSIKNERGLNTSETNARYDRMVKEALYLLSSAWGDAASTIASSSNTFVQLGANIPASVLHTIEYLVQKYYVHVYNAETLLVAFLPHHETFLFDRLLQLIDLAQLPQWAFLRPYSAAVGVNGVPRTAIAKWAASTKENGGGIVLVKRMCELAKRGAKIHALERNPMSGDGNGIRRGTSLFISFAAAILAESLHLQFTAIGSINEATLRCLVPFVLGAVEPNNSKKKKWSLGALCSEWRVFGHVMISLLVDKCDLSSELCEAFSTGILKGAMESIRLLRSEMEDDDGDDRMDLDANQMILDLSADSILALMSIVLGNTNKKGEKIDDDLNSYLPTVSSRGSELIGCNLPYGSFRVLMKFPSLPATLGYLFEDKNIDLKHLVSGAITMTISEYITKKTKGGESDRSMQVLCAMIGEPSLKEMWVGDEGCLSASTAAYIVAHANDINGTGNFKVFAKILKSLRGLNSVACDTGVGYAVTNASSISDHEEKESNRTAIRELLSIAGICEQVQMDSNKKKSKKKLSADTQNFDLMLPPRIALEHPDPKLRVDAIDKLTKDSGGMSEEEQEDIASAILRRYASDDNISVVSESAKALLKMSSEGTMSELFILQNQVAENTVRGFAKTVKALGIMSKRGRIERSPLSKDEAAMLCAGLKLSGMIAHNLQTNLDLETLDIENDYSSENMFDSYDRLVQGIVTIQYYCDCDEGDLFSDVKIAAQGALLSAVNTGMKAKRSGAAMDNIVKSVLFQIVLQRSIHDLSSSESSNSLERERLLWFFLRQTVLIEENDRDNSLVELILDASILLLERYEKKISYTAEFAENSSILTKNLETCVSNLLKGGHVDEITKLISDLLVIRSNETYENVCLIVMALASKIDPDLYPHHLFEIVSRPNLTILGTSRALIEIERFVRTVDPSVRHSVCGTFLVCAIALTCHSDLGIRESALDLIARLKHLVVDSDSMNAAFKCLCSVACGSNAPMRSNIKMDGSNALPKLLRSAVASGKKDGSILRQVLLESCAELATKHLLDNKTSFAGEGICHSIILLLNAFETAGEKSFSLNDRWCLAGKPIFDHFITRQAAESSEKLDSLIDCTVVMLKGVIVDNAVEDNIIISTGPATSGRRRRAYSVSMSSEIAFINPYPNDMKKSLAQFFVWAVANPNNSFVRQLCEAINRLVLGRSSWANGIFSKLDNKTQQIIFTSVLALRSDGGIESAGLVMLGLPLTAGQFVEAISSKSSRASKLDSGGLLALTALTDCIRAQSSNLESDRGVTKLSSILYDKLSSLSTQDFVNGSDYARTCIIHALLAIVHNISGGTSRKSSEKKLTKEIDCQSKLLVSLLGGEDANVKPLVSSKSMSLCLQLLTHLCSISPTSVVGSLIPALMNAISVDAAGSNVVRDALMAVVPSYCEHAQIGGSSLFTFFQAFAKKCEAGKDSWDGKVQMYNSLIDAFMSVPDKNSGAGVTISNVITIYIASQALSNQDTVMEEDEESPINFVEELLSNLDPDSKISATLPLLKYVGELLQCLDDHRQSTGRRKSFFIIEVADICGLAIHGPSQSESTTFEMPYQNEQKIPITWCVMTILSVVKNIYSDRKVKHVIRHGNDVQAKVCLSIWQELVALQSVSSHSRNLESNLKDDTNDIWDHMGNETSGILSSLQNLLPAPHFLASVGSLINDNDVEIDIQRRAIMLLAERAMETDPTSHEAVLFLEMLPDLVKFARQGTNEHSNSESSRHISIRSQTSFKAIDQLSKSLGMAIVDDKLRRKRTKLFMPALQASAAYLYRIATAFKIPSNIGGAEADISSFQMETQVLSSAALCAASLITLLKAKALTVLPTLVKPLIKLLTAVNACDVTTIKDKDSQDSITQSIRLIQLSALRCLVAVSDHIPQFLIPYVDGLLTVHGLPSTRLRGIGSEEELAVNGMANRFDNSLASGPPVRQLIPILSKSTAKCLKMSSEGEPIWQESLIIFKILKLCIEKATRSDLGPLAGKIISSLVQAYAFDCDMSTRIELIDVANETLLAMVMKLSEAQLRPLYAKLRDWRGDLNASQADGAAARRRNAFWSLSAAMSKELRSIFLPCMNSVVGDVVEELEFAVSCLCVTTISSKGNKRQKLTEMKPNVSDLTRPLQSLLLCLEASLNADAHDGGTWIRGDNGQRYTAILQPLTKLLSATIPQDYNILPILPDPNKPLSAYERLVQGIGTEEHGNVSNCITSLAAAAGNEQMWKPLNHALLDACGNEKRSEVRKSGVKTLLSIIHALGEEYMVLLPECLPLLSELLEDEDEDIVALTKQCVQQGEELLGESLEDNLR